MYILFPSFLLFRVLLFFIKYQYEICIWLENDFIYHKWCVHAVIWRRYHLSVNIHTSSCYHSTSLRIQMFQYMYSAAIDLHTSWLWLWLQKIDRIHYVQFACNRHRENVPFGRWIRVWFGFGFGFNLFINIFKHRQHNYNQSFKNKLEEARCHEWCALTWNRNINTFAHNLICIFTRYIYILFYICVCTHQKFSISQTNERTNEWMWIEKEWWFGQ